jgi:hypothetical protein
MRPHKPSQEAAAGRGARVAYTLMTVTPVSGRVRCLCQIL